MDIGSLLAKSQAGNTASANGQAQDDIGFGNSQGPPLSVASLNAIMYANGLAANGLAGFNLNGTGFALPHGNANGLASASANELVPNGFAGLNMNNTGLTLLQASAGLSLPVGNGAFNTAGLNSVGMSLAGLNTAGLNLANLNTAGLNLANLNTTGLNIANLNTAGLNLANLNTAGLNLANLNTAGLPLAGGSGLSLGSQAGWGLAPPSAAGFGSAAVGGLPPQTLAGLTAAFPGVHPQAFMAASAPHLFTGNAGRVAGPAAPQASVAAELSASEEEENQRDFHDCSAEETCDQLGNPLAQKTPSNIAKYFELPTAAQMENPDRPYKDYSQIPDNTLFRRAVAGGKRKNAGGSNFPSKLHEILSRDDVADIISWSPHGRSWRVHKPKTFEEKIIPQYFRHSKYNSFTRQVNGWGFRRITQGPDHNAYYHEFFLRKLPHLCKRMRRLTVAVHGRCDTCSHAEPDFYRISEVSPLPEVTVDKSPPQSMASFSQQASQEKSAKNDRDKNRKPSPLPTSITPSYAASGLSSLQQHATNPSLPQFDSSFPQQPVQTQLLPQLMTDNFLSSDPSDFHQRLLAHQALINGLQSQQVGSSVNNIGLRNMSPASMQGINSQIAAQLVAAAAQGFNMNIAKPSGSSGSGFPFS